VDDNSTDVCISCKKAFTCMGQGIFVTTIYNEWNPEIPKPLKPNEEVENNIPDEK
jgi:hypothetical protein